MAKPFQDSRRKLLQHSRLPPGKSGKDNTFGSGYAPPPPHLTYLSNFINGFSQRDAEHKVFVHDAEGPGRVRTDMFTFPVTLKFSIMGRDMESLLNLGLSRIQQNDHGTLSVYFDTEYTD